MNQFASLPLELRIAIMAGIGFFIVGPFTTWAIANWSHFGARNSAWNRLPEGARQRRAWYHFLPVLGWILRAGERDLWTKYFWVRPALIELLLPIALASLYWWEAEGGLVPKLAFGGQVSQATVHWQAIGHLILLPLLVVATFIDFDEMLIPDYITVPGTLIALVAAVFIPHWQLYEVEIGKQQQVTQLQFMSPSSVPVWSHTLQGLIAGIAMFLGWCFALADRRIILRRGLKKGFAYFFAGLVRNPNWKLLAAISIAGPIYITAVYVWIGGDAWLSLLHSLCGIAIGGGIVWLIRIVASLALRMEALGFGDVLLMAMVGAYLGWQPVAISFFYAPIFALPVVIFIAMLTGQAATPFGPYLCIATMYCLVFWDSIWNAWLQPVIDMLGGPTPIALMFVTMSVLMGGMLSLYRIFKIAISKLKSKKSAD